MSNQLLADYEAARRPYLESEGAVDWRKYIHLRSWRYVVEVNSACNLRCTHCHAGNRKGYQYTPGTMKPELLEKILDKIVTENPDATVCAYVNSEPMLHPDIAAVIRSIKGRGLHCEIATNANVIRDIEGIFGAGPDLFTMSLSGWTQQVYERAHAGGDVDAVKNNIYAVNQVRRAMNYQGFVGISYHFYRDNMGPDQWGELKQFAKNLGLPIVTSMGRTISMENTVQALRHLEFAQTGKIRPYPKGPGALDLNQALPTPSAHFMAGLNRLIFHPKEARAFYDRWPISPVCVMADVFTEIRFDGKVQLCAWTDDRRLILGDYLDMSHAEICAARRGHPFCKECLHYRTNHYFQIAGRDGWGDIPLP